MCKSCVFSKKYTQKWPFIAKSFVLSTHIMPFFHIFCFEWSQPRRLNFVFCAWLLKIAKEHHTFRRDVQNRDFQFRYKVHVFVHCPFLSKHKVHVFCRFSKKSCTKYKYIKFDMKSNFQVQEYKFFGHFLVKIVYFELKILTSSSSYSFFFWSLCFI